VAQSPAQRLAAMLDSASGDPERQILYKVHADNQGNWNGYWSRPEQREPPGPDWTIWPVIAGRGFGKTRTGAEYLIERSRLYRQAGVKRHLAGLIGRTAADVRDTMIEGESGLMECLERRKIRAKHLPGKRQVLIRDPRYRATIHTYSAMEPDSLRGPQHHTLWGDEPAAWRHIVDAQGNTAWTNAMFGLRLDAPGLKPRVIATTTPKPIPLVREWFAAVDAGDPAVVMTRGKLHDNLINLAPSFILEVTRRYPRGSPLARQEIMGALVLTVEGALWRMEAIEAGRVVAAPELARIIVAVDPPAEPSGEAGIIAIGIEAGRQDDNRRHLYVLEDASIGGRAEVWGMQAAACARRWGAIIVYERNQGGDMVRATIQQRDPTLPCEWVQASTSKWERAEPVASMYGAIATDDYPGTPARVHHVGYFGMLESQQVTWTEKDDWSPDRLDALVHGCRYLAPDVALPPGKAVAPHQVLQPFARARSGRQR
jgi:phage terminase large subunit-like protein